VVESSSTGSLRCVRPVAVEHRAVSSYFCSYFLGRMETGGAVHILNMPENSGFFGRRERPKDSPIHFR
jgi:hypothetical protein